METNINKNNGGRSKRNTVNSHRKSILRKGFEKPELTRLNLRDLEHDGEMAACYSHITHTSCNHKVC